MDRAKLKAGFGLCNGLEKARFTSRFAAFQWPRSVSERLLIQGFLPVAMVYERLTLMTTAIKQLFYWMPFLFGIGFIAPLIAQLLEYWQVAAPWGLSPVMFGLLIGAPWGLYATLRGRWV